MNECIPDKAAWGDFSFDPELKYPYKLFGGKSIKDVMPLFVDHPIERAAELRFASSPVFN